MNFLERTGSVSAFPIPPSAEGQQETHLQGRFLKFKALGNLTRFYHEQVEPVLADVSVDPYLVGVNRAIYSKANLDEIQEAEDRLKQKVITVLHRIEPDRVELLEGQFHQMKPLGHYADLFALAKRSRDN